MQDSFTFRLPLKVQVSKRNTFILNLNNYRNAHHRVLSVAKKNYHHIISGLGLPNVKYNKVKVYYKIYPPSRRLYDGSNVVSVVDKFVMDSLQKIGVIKDDDIFHVVAPTWLPCKPDKDFPRIEVTVVDISGTEQEKYLQELELIYNNKQ